jgi:hypothetical protein
MTKNIARIAVLALGLASFTGSAIAGNGNGGPPPGQEKKADQAAPAAQPAAQPTAPPAQGNPGQQKKASAPSQSTAKSPGQAKQAAKASTSTPGMKPSSTTSKWTTCSTGGTATAATCKGNGPKADGSKQYGNGKTAAQIANSRGAPAGTKLTGPGNSQPHKVSVCGKPNNRSGGVDVHAVKSYSAANCTHSATQSQSTESKSDCTGTTVTSTSTATAYANKRGKVKAHGNAGQHGKHKGLAGKQETVVTSTFTPSNANCGTAQAGTAPAAAGTASAAATAGTGNTAATPTANGVLGTQVVVLKPVKKPAGGVLGATARLGNFATRGTLPFTGLPIWIVVLVALALIAGGFAVRSLRPSRQL